MFSNKHSRFRIYSLLLLMLLLASQFMTGQAGAAGTITLTDKYSTATLPPAVPYQVLDYQLPEQNGLLIRGIMGVPAGQNCPVVLLLHGRHLTSDNDTTAYYRGLSYLVEALAMRGFIALSMEVNPVYHQADEAEVASAIALVSAHLTALQQANGGQQLFALDLKDKVDLNKLNLIGHSRGGGLAPLLANYLGTKQFAVKACVLLAPTTYIGVANEDGSKVYGTADYPVPGMDLHLPVTITVPTAVLLPQFDGDITDQVGYSYFLNAIQQSKPPVPVLCAYLHRANHVSLNTQLVGRTDPTVFPDQQLAEPGEIRRYVSKFTVAVLSLTNFTNQSITDLATNNHFAQELLASAFTIYDPTAKPIIQTPIADKSGVTALKMQVDYLISSPHADNAKNNGTLLIPGFDGSKYSTTGLYRLRWDKPAMQPTVWFATTPQDATEKNDILLLYWMVDASDPAYLEGDKLALEVIVAYQDGSQDVYPFNSDSNMSLFIEKGTKEIDPTGRTVFSRTTPLLCQVIALPAQKSTATSPIARIGIRGTSPNGNLALFGIYGTKVHPILQ